MNRFLFPLLISLALVVYARLGHHTPAAPAEAPSAVTQTRSAPFDAHRNPQLAAAFANQTSDLWLEGEGTVVKQLKDDHDGSRHQRFIVQVNPGQTVLIAHNIDLAPRIDALRENDRVRFRGEYEWNAKGGVVHWTHHDPQDRHDGGWIEHAGRRYR